MEKKEIFFREKQRFRQWWALLILWGINLLFLYGVYKQVVLGEQFGNKPMGNTGLLITTGLTVLLTLAMMNFRLDTEIKADGVYIRFFPIHLRFRYYAWSSLIHCYVRQYSPLKEYGGWGIRMGLSGKGNALNISGDKGLQLAFAKRKKLLIGTNRPEELTAVLKQLGQWKEPEDPLLK